MTATRRPLPPLVRRAGERVVGRTAGRARWQGLYERLHAIALRGLNFGEGDFSESGEAWVVEHVSRQCSSASPVVFDIGANVGGWTRMVLGAFGPAVTVHAFEPADGPRQQLLRQVGDDARVHVVDKGVGAAVGTETLYGVEGLTGLSSLHKRELDHVGLEMQPLDTVELTTVDDYCEQEGISHIDFLKIDVEGHELAVLKGASAMLAAKAVSAVQFEFGGTSIDSRTYLRDFFHVLGRDYTINRVLTDGLRPIDYSEVHETFVTVNYLAELR